jgi:hypothetical protein
VYVVTLIVNDPLLDVSISLDPEGIDENEPLQVHDLPVAHPDDFHLVDLVTTTDPNRLSVLRQ